MNDAEFEKELQQQIEQLPRQMKPSRDLWAGIDHAIEQQQGTKRFSLPKLTAVAAGFSMLGLTAWLTLNGNFSPALQAPGEGLQYVTVMTETFEKQKQSLLTKYEDQKPSADNWRSQLNELNDAATAIKKVLDQDPTNAQLIKMLQQTYQQQLDLIKAVNKSPWQTI
jgi:hypothetical protein